MRLLLTDTGKVGRITVGKIRSSVLSLTDLRRLSVSESRRQLDIQNLGVQWGRAGKRDVLR